MSFTHKAVLLKKICCILLLVWLVANTGVPAVFAAPPAVSDSQEQNRRARQDAEERREREQQKNVFLQQEDKTAEDFSLPEEKPAFFIKTLVLSGDSAQNFPWAKKLLERYAGRKIGMAGINLIVKRLTNAFIDRGYITTRIAVPEQDLISGVLSLEMVPGRIGEIRLSEDSVKRNWQTAFPCRSGDILNLRELEQALEQIKRVPSQDATMKLVPGKKPGESDVVLRINGIKPWRLSFWTEDSGIQATGKVLALTGLAVDNLLNSNDIFKVAFIGDAEGKGKFSGVSNTGFYYSIPAGDRTYTFINDSTRYHQPLLGYTQHGEIKRMTFSMKQLLHRDQTSVTNIEFSVIKGRIRSFFEDYELEVQRQITTAAEIGLSRRQYFGKDVLDVELAYKQGVPWLGAQTDSGSATTRYHIWLLDASLTKPVTLGGSQGRYSVAFHGQYTNDPVYGTEYISIGDRYTVRGFDGEQPLSAERGWYLRNELSLPLGSSGVNTYLGLDCGEVYGPATQGLSGRMLIGSVVGLRGWAKDFSYDVFVGWPLEKPAELETASPTFGFHFAYEI